MLLKVYGASLAYFLSASLLVWLFYINRYEYVPSFPVWTIKLAIACICLGFLSVYLTSRRLSNMKKQNFKSFFVWKYIQTYSFAIGCVMLAVVFDINVRLNVYIRNLNGEVIHYSDDWAILLYLIPIFSFGLAVYAFMRSKLASDK